MPECKQRHDWATNLWHSATPMLRVLKNNCNNSSGPLRPQKTLVTAAGEFVYCTDWCSDGAAVLVEPASPPEMLSEHNAQGVHEGDADADAEIT